ncbi:hypothetical protein SAMN05421805_10322 [Saccharopolyspora antimicrobica]|uniref:Uncharacterized protein n=1 Tax=Saccharopolyspora antimicrobica TaxID=455193 RepID=A0A1I4WS84_9PSEU|nr:hypothetical protein ATL45_1268 [Saccharopolyspora antimicrobica]SFN16043.1 hypothetical protein SAMN05421805_10322 [Saccharopolyspora antimicrobica]
MESSQVERGFSVVGTSLVIVLLGMLVPVLAAAPFYVADRRREQQELELRVRELEAETTGSDD